MTAEDLVIYSTRRLNAGAMGNAWQGFQIDVAAQIPAALRRLADKVMNDDARRGLLQQDYSVTLDASGVGDLLAATGSVTSTAGEASQQGVYLGIVKDADGDILQPLKNYQAFLSPQSQCYSYYTLQNKKIYTRSKQQQVTVPSEVTTVASPLTITCSYVPAAVTSVPDEIANDLVECLCEIVLTKIEAFKSKK